MKILLAEDEKHKAESIKDFLKFNFPDAYILEARSVNSAMLILESQNVDIALLDMSLPTYDISIDEAGGRSQRFGGEEIIDFLYYIERFIPVYIITQYSYFIEDNNDSESISTYRLNIKLQESYPEVFKEIIYYDGASNKWQKHLKRLIEEQYD